MASQNDGAPGGGPGAAVVLSMPVLQPTPVEGCEICEAQAAQRSAAHQRGDYSAVSDANARLRNHKYHRATW